MVLKTIVFEVMGLILAPIIVGFLLAYLDNLYTRIYGNSHDLNPVNESPLQLISYVLKI